MLRCFDYAQHDNCASFSSRVITSHNATRRYTTQYRITGIIFNTRDVYSLSYSIRTAPLQMLRLRSA